MLEIKNLRASYGEIEALHDVSFHVEDGAIVALLGANGAGKTTTLRAISGTIKHSGTITFDGVSLTDYGPEDVARLGIAHVPEGRGTLAELTVWENLMLGGYLLRSEPLHEQYARVTEYFPWMETACRHAERRRAADARDRARTDDEAEGDLARRAVDGPCASRRARYLRTLADDQS